MLAALRKSEAVPQVESVNPHTFFVRTREDSAAVNEAIRSLKPWLANEVSLTEENAKECYRKTPTNPRKQGPRKPLLSSLSVPTNQKARLINLWVSATAFSLPGDHLYKGEPKLPKPTESVT